MATRKERLLKKYLDKKRKQRNRDELYAQIAALKRPQAEIPTTKPRKRRHEMAAEENSSEGESGSESPAETLEEQREQPKQEEEQAEESLEDGEEMLEMLEMYLWDVHARNAGCRVDKEGEEPVVETRSERIDEPGEEVVDVDVQKTLKEYETREFWSRSEEMEIYRKTLPIYYEKAEIIHVARKASVLFVRGATGCGKTTQIPQFLYEGGFAVDGMIGVTQPRRLSAISIANRINEETGEEVCGYQIKYESSVTPETKIKIMTDGVLIREIQEDFLLSRYSTVVVDEVHERSTNVDLLISIIPRIMQLRKARGNELKLVLMSATGNVEEMRAFLGDVDVFTCPEQRFPVSVFYEDKTEQDYLNAAYERVRKIVLSEDGRRSKGRCGEIGSSVANDRSSAILVFLTSKQDIYQLKSRLDASELDATILPLHSSLSKVEQDLVFERTENRKIILSTNVAETSITIPDVVFVVDSGKVKNRNIDSAGLVRYSVDFITKSSAAQRMGRAGRTGPGVCYRLYSGEAYEMFYESMEPQILREPLGDVVLSLLSLGIRDVYSFPFLSKPGNRAVNDALLHLQSLGAVDKGLGLTATGKTMARYPVEPRLARLLCIHGAEDVFLELATIVALTASNTEIRRNQNNHSYFDASKSDLLAQLGIYSDFLKSKNKRAFCVKMDLNYNTAAEVTKMVRHLLRISGASTGGSLDLSPTTSARLRKIIYCAFVDHLAVPSSNSHFFRANEVCASASGISIDKEDFVVFESLVSGKNRLYMRNATVVDRSWF